MLAALVAASSIILGSCGGGGAAQEPGSGGVLTITPAAGTFYAGVVYTFQIQGGRAPFSLSSSEPALFPVPDRVEGRSFQVMPNNPGVVDRDLPPGALPVRSLLLTVRDSANNQFTTSTGQISVAQNFFTGYGFSLTSNCAPDSSGGVPGACAGGTSVMQFTPVIHGNLYGSRQYRFDVVTGNFQFVSDTGTRSSSITLTTDHEGKVIVRIRASDGISTEIATFRITDIATGTSALQAFAITGVTPGALTLIPDTVQFTGVNSETCGQGTADIFVFDGTPPFTAASSSTAFSVQVSGNRITVRALGTCDSGTIIVTDVIGNRGTATVESVLGTATTPNIAVTPTTLDLNGLNNGCGYSSFAAVTGGASPFAISSHPRVGAFVSGNVLTVTRIASGDGATVFPTSGTVTVTDGRSSVAVTISNVEANCP